MRNLDEHGHFGVACEQTPIASDVFTLPDTETEKETGKIIACTELCQGVHTRLLRERDQCKLSLVSVAHFIGICIGLGVIQCKSTITPNQLSFFSNWEDS